LGIGNEELYAVGCLITDLNGVGPRCFLAESKMRG